MSRAGVLLSMVLLLGFASDSFATPGAFTDPAAFQAAVPAPTGSVDFETLADGAVVSGTTQTPAGMSTGIVLPAPLADVLDPGGPDLELRVVQNGGDNPASSGTRSLGVVDAGNFHAIAAGSAISFGFSQAVDAFGLTIITPEEPGGALFDADTRLVVAGEPTAQLALADGQLLGTFNGREYRAYFLGVVANAPFSAASLEYDAATPDSGYFFNIDDLVISVPEPGALVSLSSGCLLLTALDRLRSRRRRRS